MRTYEEIAKVVIQGFLFIDNEKYYIIEVKSVRGASIFMITNESRTMSAGVNVKSGAWTAEPVLSAEDKIRLDILNQLGYNYIRNYNSTIQVSQDSDFDAYEILNDFDSVPEGTYEIGLDCKLIEIDY